MTEAERLDMIEKIHRHELAPGCSVYGATIIAGPWKGYALGEAMALSQLGSGPREQQE